ncbi:MAG: ParB N-terminal domain-containing protein [Leptolyngbyaceae cyanobacterium bins.349]|nr:ParB N-terminal domain-containing protein [Leptolyngbyaceae cyanobacterium bins.349]
MKLLPIDAVNPSTYNPRIADPERLNSIELSLKKLGFLLPIYADQNGEILSGHQRHHVASRMGVKRLPVDFTKPLDLAERKAVNIAFNRGTNDLAPDALPKTLTEALQRSNVHQIAETLPDLDINSPEFYPCLNVQTMPIQPLLLANSGRWVPYARNISKTLRGKGVIMPVVIDPDGKVVNGIGRLQMLAESGEKTVQVVQISHAQAQLADAMLNLLSMDFDIHRRYDDLLRYNSFRRSRRTRNELGRGFVFAVIGSKPSYTLDLDNPDHLKRWKAVHGSTVLDFGAGHLTETKILQQVGIDCTPFEPYHITKGEEIDKVASLEIVRAFLDTVRSGKRFSSIFISSVLNSVPFEGDRCHIVTLTAALADDKTRLFAVASSTQQTGWRNLNGANPLNKSDSSQITFKLDYEPGIGLGDISKLPKVQKYHTPSEFRELFLMRWQEVKVNLAVENVQAICRNPRPIDPTALKDAIAFEFDLPYPDGSCMDMVDVALEAFSTRLGVAL